MVICVFQRNSIVTAHGVCLLQRTPDALYDIMCARCRLHPTIRNRRPAVPLVPGPLPCDLPIAVVFAAARTQCRRHPCSEPLKSSVYQSRDLQVREHIALPGSKVRAADVNRERHRSTTNIGPHASADCSAEGNLVTILDRGRPNGCGSIVVDDRARLWTSGSRDRATRSIRNTCAQATDRTQGQAGATENPH